MTPAHRTIRTPPAYRAHTWVSPVPITCHVIGCLWRDGLCVYCGKPEEASGNVQ